VWNLETGKIVHRDQDPRQQLMLQFRVKDVTFLPQAYSVVSVGQNHAVWEALTGKSIHKFPYRRNVPSSFGVSLSPDGKWAVCSRPGVGQIVYWDTSTGTEHRVKVADARLAAYLPDGRLLLSCGEFGNRLRLFDIDRETAGDLFAGKTSTITRIRLSPDGKRAVTISPSVALWDVPRQKLKSQLRRPAYCAGFSPDSRQLVIGGKDGRLTVVRCDTGEELLRFTAQRDVIHDVVYLRTGQHVLTAGGGGFPAHANEPTADYAVRLWHLPQP
jgi:WD40 repeat protein